MIHFSKEVYHVFARLIAETDELSTENIKAILKQTQIETGAKVKVYLCLLD